MVNEIKKLNIGQIKENIDLKKYTTYKVGGIGKILVVPENITQLIKLLKYLDENKIKHKIIGNGSNLIFLGDYNGVLIKLDNLNKIEINGNSVIAGAGTSLIHLAMKCSKLGLSGLEFATGIPGTIGGSIYMNAGAYKEDMSCITKKVKVLDESDGVVDTFNKDELIKFNKKYNLNILIGK